MHLYLSWKYHASVHTYITSLIMHNTSLLVAALIAVYIIVLYVHACTNYLSGAERQKRVDKV